MARIHVGLKVSDVNASVTFYSQLFGTEPALVRDDYAKWMLDDPLLNFSVNTHGDEPVGSAHFGIQVNDEQRLEVERSRLERLGFPLFDQNDLVCGYQLQHKSWVQAPDGVMWEVFFTEGVVDEYGTDDMPCGEMRCCDSHS